ncbi:MAG: hypothetical protein R3F55_17050 [Alphaproteobacteria bacterium]
MTSSTPSRTLDWRVYLVRPDSARVARLPRRSWQALKAGTASRPAYANHPVRIVYAFMLADRGRPTLLLALEGSVWRFDTDGRVDNRVPPFDDRRIGLESPFAADVLPPEVICTGDRWQPCAAIRQEIEREIWPAGAPSLAPAAPAPARERPRPTLEEALAAVGKAGMARTMSRLVGELALTQPTTEKLMAALAVEPDFLRDLILAETASADALVH